jgi:hypothetical protein
MLDFSRDPATRMGEIIGSVISVFVVLLVAYNLVIALRRAF